MFKNIPGSFIRCFSGNRLIWHGAAIVSTYFLAVSGFDWFYYRTVSPYFIYQIPASLLGLLVPVILPLWFYARAKITKDAEALKNALLLGEAVLTALFLSYFYKALTGRAHPIGDIFGVETLTDITRDFQFGFLKGGILWGWPSSHTTVAIAAAVILWFVFKDRRARVLTAGFAIYVAFGMAGTLHWFSDVTAGVFFGLVAGFTVLRARRLNNISAVAVD